MRVAILTATARAGDAIGNQVSEKVAFFLQRGVDLRVFADSSEHLHPAVRTCYRSSASLVPPGEDWQFLASSDLILVEYGRDYPLLRLLPLLAGTKPRILFDYYGVTPPELWGPHNREILEMSVQRRGIVWCGDVAVTHSRFTRRELLDDTRFPADRCHGSFLPIDIERFSPGRAARDLRRQLGLGAASLLLFVGRVASNKRVPILVEALDHLRNVTPPVHAVVVGQITDLYELEMLRCKERATDLGLADRVHFLGHVSDECLPDIYRSADVFVMPSLHEGFCIPVLEAMATGTPVVAARAGALPETVGTAGLTFVADDADDLVRQLSRVLATSGDQWPAGPAGPQRIAVVCFRYGTGFAGGVETSLRTMAEALHHAGHHVEVFTTCAATESGWTNNLPEGPTFINGLSVQRFPIDVHEPDSFQRARRRIEESAGKIPAQWEQQFVDDSLHSTPLIDALRRVKDPFDAIITGPYLIGLSADVAREFTDRTLLAPCFHDERLVSLQVWHQVYDRIGGILFHSPEEQSWAEAELGFNHPGAVCVGTFLDPEVEGDPERGRSRVGTGRPYLVFCGRLVAEKGLPLLLDYGARYCSSHPDRFTFAFMGQGNIPIPQAAWARDLGFVEESVKRDVLAGAAALLHLSCHESLSLAALEAWRAATPVVVDVRCEVLVGHLRRCRGGRAVASFDAFAAALDDLWQDPAKWQALGRQGQEYTRTHYGSHAEFIARLERAIHDLKLPLAERMRRRGLARAAQHARPLWRDCFGRLIEEVLDQPARPHRQKVALQLRSMHRSVALGEQTTLVPVRITNRGTHALLPDGPGRVRLRSQVVDQVGERIAGPVSEVPLPAFLVPGQTLAASVPVTVPPAPGTYRVMFSVIAVGRAANTDLCMADTPSLELSVGHTRGSSLEIPSGSGSPLLQAVEAALAQAQRLQQLPDSYADITQGWFAQWKAWIKRKLLGNFKHAYVDVLSRQQSAFNQRLLTAIQELAECCAAMEADYRARIQALEAGLASKGQSAPSEPAREDAVLNATS
jgi:glycosyltransferase involved in cell wall biosynthesis